MKTEDCKQLSGFLFLPTCKHCTKCLAGSLAYWIPLLVCPLGLLDSSMSTLAYITPLCICPLWLTWQLCLYVHSGLLYASVYMSTLAYLTALSICPLRLTLRPWQCVHFGLLDLPVSVSTLMPGLQQPDGMYVRASSHPLDWASAV